jgi:hypothetical protein
MVGTWGVKLRARRILIVMPEVRPRVWFVSREGRERALEELLEEIGGNRTGQALERLVQSVLHRGATHAAWGLIEKDLGSANGGLEKSHGAFTLVEWAGHGGQLDVHVSARAAQRYPNATVRSQLCARRAGGLGRPVARGVVVGMKLFGGLPVLNPS